MSAELPVRLEFFGEELEKLREFDPASQRSLDAIEVVRLTPSGYGPLVADALRDSMPDGLEHLLSPEALELLLEGGTPEGMRRLMGLAWQHPASLLDYLPPNTLIAIDGRRHCLSHGQQWFDHAGDHYADVAQDLGLDASTAPELLPPGCIAPRLRRWSRQLPSPASTWRNCTKPTTTPTASIWPPAPCRPTPTPSASWRAW